MSQPTFTDDEAESRRNSRLEYRRRYYAANKEKWKLDHQQNREQRLAQRRAKYRHDPEVKKGQDLKRQFGIGMPDYFAMLASQGGVCAVCLGSERSIDPRTKEKRMLAVDHCHKTGRVRGLLCSHCNRGIGMLKDSPTLLRAALNYLEKP